MVGIIKFMFNEFGGFGPLSHDLDIYDYAKDEFLISEKLSMNYC